ncbi:RDD family protein [Echinicola shivajiensis]|uniref:RDD family protein n=1 Tax=Echinicola shivajiensis TaxID=1035916 RepID=UPI001BFBFB4F|nr:RDD family protein [Echinicola shivajiensis]
MKKLVIRRLLAGMIDYGCIMVYALILLAIFSGVYFVLQVNPASIHPLFAQSIGFLTLTLPVFIYFYQTENGRYHGTLGKRALKIRVVGGNVWLRNVLKLLPWEMGHAGVHWMIFFANRGEEPALWLWILLIFPQLLTLGYWVSILFNRGRTSIYDHLAKCRIKMTV